MITTVSGPSLGLKSILKITGLEPGTPRLSMLSECANHLRYIPIDLSAHTHSIAGTGPCGGLLSPHAYKFEILKDSTLKIQNFLVSNSFANIFHHVKLTHEHKWQFS